MITKIYVTLIIVSAIMLAISFVMKEKEIDNCINLLMMAIPAICCAISLFLADKYLSNNNGCFNMVVWLINMPSCYINFYSILKRMEMENGEDS